MVDVSEKMIEAGSKEIFRLGMNATEAIAPVELCRAIYTAMHSAREVDGETVERVIRVLDELDAEAKAGTLDSSGSHDDFKRRCALRIAIAAMGEVDVR